MATELLKGALRTATGDAVKIKRLRQMGHVNLVRELVRGKDLVVVAHVGPMPLEESMVIKSTLHDADARMTVIKNSMKARALEAEGLGALVPLMQGRVAICAGDDNAKLSKALLTLGKKNPNFFPLGGLLAQRQVVEASDLAKLAKMPPRDEVYGAMISAMMPGSVLQIPSPAIGLAAVLQAHVTNLGGDASSSEQSGAGGDEGS